MPLRFCDFMEKTIEESAAREKAALNICRCLDGFSVYEAKQILTQAYSMILNKTKVHAEVHL